VLITAVALAAPLLAPHSPLAPVGTPEAPPGTAGFLLGGDSVGRDVLSRVLYGVRASWFAALGVVALGVLLGGAVRAGRRHPGRWVDNLLMRITDGFLALPAPIVAIAVVAALGPSLVHTLVAVSIVWCRSMPASSEVRCAPWPPAPMSRRHGWRAAAPGGSPCGTCCPEPSRPPW